jgi:hypothetical protein
MECVNIETNTVCTCQRTNATLFGVGPTLGALALTTFSPALSLSAHRLTSSAVRDCRNIHPLTCLGLAQVLRNTPTKFAHHFVPAETEKCQQDCGIAQMWATLFWASQIAFSLGCVRSTQPTDLSD